MIEDLLDYYRKMRPWANIGWVFGGMGFLFFWMAKWSNDPRVMMIAALFCLVAVIMFKICWFKLVFCLNPWVYPKRSKK
jgi:hypothetical protein